MSADPLPDWFFPPPEGWTADDLDRLPPSAPSHIELIDGALIVTAPQRSFHANVMNRLWADLDAQAPEGIGVQTQMTVKLGERQRPEPDVLVFRRPEQDDSSRTYYLPEDVLLMVEIVSPESEERDRKTKPIKYAEAGIPHFWLVEEESPGSPEIRVYELDRVTQRYTCTSIAREVLKLSVPFPIAIDVRRLNR
ncbi:Uma2 family endonuclease [Nocardiopsis composta]|uniref:Uma2 family endonuclease n=1 Tax=Nocardiopsis composta TaxID=157465 RepID=A0A7W8VES9_9ACTN|nr:Uma2 family endonuclease [Nocardiopsis composta]MBB5433403.1 Uma2 family endonuclease [Nocardiopsis composta]